MTKLALAFAPLALFATTLLAQHAEPPAEAAPAQKPATQLVVIETEMGDITVEIETERAPITAANFLRYVDEDRFDGTHFYRAMHLEWGEPPNGLLQGGTQMDPERVLPAIAHEPTTQTELSHTAGALSMARYDPGTATGDFSIMIKDQTGLDATPRSPDPSVQAGFAVFGYVVDGMEVVEAIHAAPIDPAKGEGWLKGQMLADPVEIVDMRRIDALPVAPAPVEPDPNDPSDETN